MFTILYQSNSGECTTEKTCIQKYRRFKKFSEEKFISDLEKNDFDTLISDSNIDIAYNNFESAITETINTHAPMQKKESCP